MIIDKLSNKTYDPSEITYIAQLEIRAHLSQAEEDNLQRKILGSILGVYTLSTEEQQEIDDYKTLLSSVQSEAAQAVIDNQLLVDAIAYENAVIRLRQFELSVGRAEQTVYKTENGAQVVDYVIHAVAPLSATVEKTVYNGINQTTETVTNPLIEQDEAERSAAQAIVDNATDEVLALVSQREEYLNGLSAN